MPFDRANLLYLLHILEEYSDDTHILPMSTIIAKMKSLYGLTIDRRTVYGAVEMLQSIGYDISIYYENGKGYYLRSRILEPSEVRLLMDAVYGFPCISAKQTTDLIKKLQSALSIYERKQYQHLIVIKPERKTENRSVLYNVEVLDEAISKKRIVAFTYLQYGPDKKLHPRRENEYTINPYEMLCVNERYYLLCIKEKQKNISFYRIDLMKDITLTDRPLEKNECTKNLQEVQKMPYAFPGHPETIVLRCNKDTLRSSMAFVIV